MHETGAVIFAAIETVVSIAVIVFFIYWRPVPVEDDETPSWLAPDWDASAALDRLTLRYEQLGRTP